MLRLKRALLGNSGSSTQGFVAVHVQERQPPNRCRGQKKGQKRKLFYVVGNETSLGRTFFCSTALHTRVLFCPASGPTPAAVGTVREGKG